MSASEAAPRWRAVLFDLDGTLTDPKLGITRSIQYALRKRGIPAPDADALEPFIGPPLLRDRLVTEAKKTIQGIERVIKNEQ